MKKNRDRDTNILATHADPCCFCSPHYSFARRSQVMSCHASRSGDSQNEADKANLIYAAKQTGSFRPSSPGPSFLQKQKLMRCYPYPPHFFYHHGVVALVAELLLKTTNQRQRQRSPTGYLDLFFPQLDRTTCSIRPCLHHRLA